MTSQYISCVKFNQHVLLPKHDVFGKGFNPILNTQLPVSARRYWLKDQNADARCVWNIKLQVKYRVKQAQPIMFSRDRPTWFLQISTWGLETVLAICHKHITHSSHSILYYLSENTRDFVHKETQPLLLIFLSSSASYRTQHKCNGGYRLRLCNSSFPMVLNLVNWFQNWIV